MIKRNIQFCSVDLIVQTCVTQSFILHMNVHRAILHEYTNADAYIYIIFIYFSNTICYLYIMLKTSNTYATLIQARIDVHDCSGHDFR